MHFSSVVINGTTYRSLTEVPMLVLLSAIERDPGYKSRSIGLNLREEVCRRIHRITAWTTMELFDVLHWCGTARHVDGVFELYNEVKEEATRRGVSFELHTTNKETGMSKALPTHWEFPGKAAIALEQLTLEELNTVYDEVTDRPVFREAFGEQYHIFLQKLSKLMADKVDDTKPMYVLDEQDSYPNPLEAKKTIPAPWPPHWQVKQETKDLFKKVAEESKVAAEKPPTPVKQWRTASGKEFAFSEMTTTHLVNVLHHILSVTKPSVKGELDAVQYKKLSVLSELMSELKTRKAEEALEDRPLFMVVVIGSKQDFIPIFDTIEEARSWKNRYKSHYEKEGYPAGTIYITQILRSDVLGSL